jgi:hypothetical protein
VALGRFLKSRVALGARSVVVGLVRARSIGKLGVERSAIFQATLEELRPRGYDRKRIRLLGEETPEGGLVPAEFVACRVPVRADRATKLASFLEEPGVRHLFEVFVHAPSIHAGGRLTIPPRAGYGPADVGL